jgi:hypothetical protein
MDDDACGGGFTLLVKYGKTVKRREATNKKTKTLSAPRMRSRSIGRQMARCMEVGKDVFSIVNNDETGLQH